MTERPDYDRRRQRVVLTKLRRNAGMEIQDVATAVGLSYPQTVRYLDGRTPLHSFRVAAFARAFGVDPLDLAAELGGIDVLDDQVAHPDTPVWSLEAELRAAGVDDELIRQTLDAGHSEPELLQKAIARMAISIYKSDTYQRGLEAASRRRA